MPAPGAWPSPLTPQRAAAAAAQYADVALTGGGRTVWWAESRPAEAGRTTILRRTGDAPAQDLLPPGFDARTRVHEYGGRCWLPLRGDALVTSSMHDQRLYLLGTDGPRALTPDTGGADRYGDPVLLPAGTHLVCVRERVGGAVSRALVAVPLDGSGEVLELWTGSDFVVAPAVSPDGRSLAFLTWDHPRMPWDGTTLRVARIDGPALTDVRPLLGGDDEAVLAPSWADDGALLAATDRSGWWNLHRVPLDGSAPTPLWTVEQDCGFPLWWLGVREHVALSDGRVAVVHGGRLAVVSGGSARDVDVPFTWWAPTLAAHGDVVVGVACTGTTAPAVVAVDTTTGGWREVATPLEQPDAAWAPLPERVTVPSAGGRRVHAVAYRPSSPDHAVPVGVAPPAVVFVHGGPTGAAQVRWSPVVSFFTSRGLLVVDVDYGGSAGHGRAYREQLRGQWGVVDVEDCEAVARWLTSSGQASRVAIRGGSAGGWTVLCALTRGDSPFAAGASWFGVADAVALAETTHDFESRYLDGLIGPLPEARSGYDERSPVRHADRLDRPVLLLQGLDDPVVPPSQAEAFLAALERSGVPHAYLAFEGEAHGFRRAESVAAALSAELSFYGQVLGFEPPGVPVLALRR